ncbi:MAG: prolyl oligopeptidase family serine peptidase [Bacteroidia bacterium]
MRRMAGLILPLLLLPATVFAHKTDTLKSKTAVGTNTMPFTLLTAGKKELHAKMPLILFLHGAGERGSDNKSQLNVGLSVMVKTLEPLPSFHSCMVLVPQCPATEKWVDTDWTQPSSSMKEMMTWPLQGTMQVMDSLIRNNPDVDSNRIYVTGYSMGGFACWELLQRYTFKFAAAIPICGGGDTALAHQLGAIPIWAFHGKKDKLVKVSRTTDMVKAIGTHDTHVKMTILEQEGHLCWNKVFSDKAVLTWMLKQNLHDQ